MTTSPENETFAQRAARDPAATLFGKPLTDQERRLLARGPRRTRWQDRLAGWRLRLMVTRRAKRVARPLARLLGWYLRRTGYYLPYTAKRFS